MLKSKIYWVGLSFGGAQFIALFNIFFTPRTNFCPIENIYLKVNEN